MSDASEQHHAEDDIFLEDAFDIHPSAYVFPQVFMSGQISIGPESSVWPMCVLRGDRVPITIGPRCNIQDGCILHGDPGFPLTLGERVTLGHGAIVHGAILEDEVLIGIGSVVLNGAVIGRGSVVGARALVTEGMQVPPGSLVLGIPGKARPLPEKFAGRNVRTAEGYVRRKERYRQR
jgi:carbonic anhydrase/acetyltransferase-like protein (isoleucine patch superfamily)